MARHENKALPQEHIRDITPRAIALPWIAAVLLLVLANAALRWYLHVLPVNRGYQIIHDKWTLLEETDFALDWMVLGDSTAAQAVDTTLIRRETGGEARNFATIASMFAVQDAWMLEEQVRRGQPPKRVIIVHAYDIWNRDDLDLRVCLTHVPRPFGFWTRTNPPLPTSARQLWRQALYEAFPAYSESVSVRIMMEYPHLLLRTKRTDLGLDATGFWPLKHAVPVAVERDTAWHKQLVATEPFRVHPLNRAALERVRELADEHGIEVFIAPSPYHDDLWADPNFQKRHVEILNFLDGISAKSPHMHVILRTPKTYPKEAMENSDHVVGDAAQDYTRAILQEVLAARADDDK